MDNLGTDNLNFIFITVPSVPAPSSTSTRYKLNHDDNLQQSLLKSFHSDTSKSMPLSAITAQLFGKQSILLSSEKDLTAKLASIFELLSSPIEKYRLIQLLTPKDARGTILTKYQLIKHLYRYTGTENVKSGTIRNLIDAIPLGKNTESPREEFYKGIINVLNHFWDECKLLKNGTFQRIKGVCMIHNSQNTIDSISIALDNLQQQKIESVKMDLIYPFMERIFDMMFMNSVVFKSIETETEPQIEASDNNFKMKLTTNRIILSCILNNSKISERHIFNALCPRPKELASEIWNSKMSVWNVIYGIEYLKNHDIHNWKKILDLTRTERVNGRFKGKWEAQGAGSTKLVISIEPGVPFLPMRCISLEGDTQGILDKVCSFKDGKRDETQGFCIEEKLDGERCCLHLYRQQGDTGKIQTKFYSRRGIIQPWYGSHVGDEKGIITKYLKSAQFEGIDSLILDGEMITFDENKGKLLGFQDVKRCAEMLYRKQNEEDEDLGSVKLYNVFYCYDVLFYNGQSLQLTELSERKNILSAVFQRLNGVPDVTNKFIKMHKWNIGYIEEDIKTALDNVISKDSEGLVLKHWKSFYFVGKHSARTIKLKPYYLKKFLDDLDVLIIGKEGGNYLCALYGGDGGDSNREDDRFRHYFVSFCLIRYGFTTEFQQYVEDTTRGFWIPYSKYSNAEMEEQKVKFGRLKPSHWIHPNNSVVLKIKARTYVNFREEDEFEDGRSQNPFLLTSTLRHPYCLEVRYDKLYNECDTVGTYYDRVENSINKKGLSRDFYGLRQKKKRSLPTKNEILLDNLNKNIVKKMKKVDTLFEGITFCVKSECYIDGFQTGVNVVNGMLEAHGGRLTTDPTQYRHGDLLMVIADIHTLSVKALNKKYSVYKFKWCTDAIRQGKLVQVDPSHYLHIKDEKEGGFATRNINRFGLNSSVSYSGEMLWEMSKTHLNEIKTTDETISLELQEELGLKFYNKSFAFWGYDTLPYDKDILDIEIGIRGGIVVEKYDANNPTDFVVVVDDIKAQLQSLALRTKIILGKDLLQECRNEKKGQLYDNFSRN